MNLKVAVAMEEKKNEQSSLKFYILPNYSFCVKAFAILLFALQKFGYHVQRTSEICQSFILVKLSALRYCY